MAAGFARTSHPHAHTHTHTHCCTTTRDTVAAFSKGKDKYNTVSGSSHTHSSSRMRRTHTHTHADKQFDSSHTARRWFSLQSPGFQSSLVWPATHRRDGGGSLEEWRGGEPQAGGTSLVHTGYEEQ